MQQTLFGEDEDVILPVSVQEDYSRLGRYAEFMVCAVLTKLGYYVLHVDAPGFDLILAVADTSLRVQVKSTSLVKEGKCRWSCRRHSNPSNGKTRIGVSARTKPIGREDADLLALYHHQFNTTVFLPVSSIGNNQKIDLPVSQVRNIESDTSLDAALAAILA